MNANESGDSVTLCIRSLKAGDQGAPRSLWDGYFGKLVRLARSRLRDTPRAARDEEDIALSAFHCLCSGAIAGRFPRLSHRDDLWRLLATLVAQKVVDQRRHGGRQKRGGGRTIGAVDLAREGAAGDVLPQVAGREPSPDVAAVLDEEY